MLTYSELITLPTFEERFQYLKLRGIVGESTFGFERHLNQNFYRSRIWRSTREKIILRDNGCDLGIEGRNIHVALVVHHMNPVTPEEVMDRHPRVLDPENLITTCHNTHLAIHFGDERMLPLDPVARRRNDTTLWH
jgi:hypothetical protein